MKVVHLPLKPLKLTKESENLEEEIQVADEEVVEVEVEVDDDERIE